MKRALRHAARHLGFTAYALADFAAERKVVFLLNEFPHSYVEIYRQRRYIEHDPIVQRARRCWRPFTWSATADDPSSPRAGEVLGEAAQHGLADGICVPVQCFNGRRAFLTLAGPSAAVSEHDLWLFQLIALHARNRLSDVEAERLQADGTKLSGREADCLRWAAEGKTSWEIAQILAISQHTADWYLNTAARKLKATNRIQAVAEAFRRGIIN
ncbi:autoinducer binding domain-containing protein [Chthonobacter albigriseus]|uniref:autoinducer binding domain-containing protein n=1 Tax=Chthonobacter albigriseus TaxID=1683161 RepID=UPI0015EFD9FF